MSVNFRAQLFECLLPSFFLRQKLFAFSPTQGRAPGGATPGLVAESMSPVPTRHAILKQALPSDRLLRNHAQWRAVVLPSAAQVTCRGRAATRSLPAAPRHQGRSELKSAAATRVAIPGLASRKDQYHDTKPSPQPTLQRFPRTGTSPISTGYKANPSPISAGYKPRPRLLEADARQPASHVPGKDSSPNCSQVHPITKSS